VELQFFLGSDWFWDKCFVKIGISMGKGAENHLMLGKLFSLRIISEPI
jgi:hypothetical protein